MRPILEKLTSDEKEDLKACVQMPGIIVLQNIIMGHMLALEKQVIRNLSITKEEVSQKQGQHMGYAFVIGLIHDCINDLKNKDFTEDEPSGA